MLGVATSVQRVLADVAVHDVVMLLDVFCAAREQVVIDHGTRPVIPVLLQVSRVKVQVAVDTMFCNNPGHRAHAIGTGRSITVDVCARLDNGFPISIDQLHVS